MKHALCTLVTVVALSACGERPQVFETNKHDSSAYTGTGKAFVAKDWKPGDKASWESHLKARNQYGQNDYTRMN